MCHLIQLQFLTSDVYQLYPIVCSISMSLIYTFHVMIPNRVYHHMTCYLDSYLRMSTMH